MECFNPFMTADEFGHQQAVPCGKCLNCKKRRTSQWSFRLMQEEKQSSSAYFITLTYDTKSVPLTRAKYATLHQPELGPRGVPLSSHLQLFFKRLRKSHGPDAKSIKYFAVGEYGGTSFRPHYHCIIYNVQLELILKPKEITLLKSTLYDGKTPFHIKQWPHGHITIGQVSGASIGYTLKYITKAQRVPVHKNDDRKPEFAIMSKGLGLNYLSSQMIQWHMNDP